MRRWSINPLFMSFLSVMEVFIYCKHSSLRSYIQTIKKLHISMYLPDSRYSLKATATRTSTLPSGRRPIRTAAASKNQLSPGFQYYHIQFGTEPTFLPGWLPFSHAVAYTPVYQPPNYHYTYYLESCIGLVFRGRHLIIYNNIEQTPSSMCTRPLHVS